MWRWQQIAEWLKEPRLGAELGTKHGRFAEYLLQKFPSLHLVTVDTWCAKPPADRNGYETYESWDFDKIMHEYRVRTAPYAERLTTIHGDTVAAAAQFADGAFDFVFIDAEHTYEAVSAEIAAWISKIKAGGFISGHDYSARFPGIVKAVNELGKPKLGSDKVWMVQC